MKVLENVVVLKGEFGFCEICDNHTQRVLVDTEIGCEICWEAYGEINQPKCLKHRLELDQLERITK